MAVVFDNGRRGFVAAFHVGDVAHADGVSVGRGKKQVVGHGLFGGQAVFEMQGRLNRGVVYRAGGQLQAVGSVLPQQARRVDAVGRKPFHIHGQRNFFGLFP